MIANTEGSRIERPPAVLVFGVLNIFFGVVGIVGCAGGLFVYWLGARTGDPSIAELYENHLHVAIYVAHEFLAAMAYLFWLVGGIGMLFLVPIGRRACLTSAIILVVLSAYSIGFFEFPNVLAAASRPTADTNPSAAISRYGALAGSTIILTCSLLQIHFLRLRRVAAAFKQ